jgi:hypothetical protein
MNGKQYALIVVLAIVAGLIGGAVASWTFVGQPVFAQNQPQDKKVITAEQFRVVDKNGNKRAVLGVRSDGSTYLTLYEIKNKERISLGVMAKGYPILTFKDADEKYRIALAHEDGVGSNFLFADENSISRVLIDQGLNGNGGLYLNGKDSTLASLKIKKNVPELRLASQDGVSHADFTIFNGMPLMRFFADKKQHIAFGLGDDSEPLLQFTDKYEKIRIGLGLIKGEPIIGFNDSTQKLIWTAP